MSTLKSLPMPNDPAIAITPPIKTLKEALNMGAPPNIAPIAPNKTNNDNDTTKRTLTLKLKSSMNEHDKKGTIPPEKNVKAETIPACKGLANALTSIPSSSLA